MFRKNLRMTMLSAVAVGVLALIPAAAFADDDNSSDTGPLAPTPAQTAEAQLQTDLQALVSLSQPNAVATVRALSATSPNRLEASIASPDGGMAYDAPLDGNLIQTLAAQASMNNQFAARTDAGEVMTDAAAVIQDLQSGPAPGLFGAAPDSAPSSDYSGA